MIWRQKKSKYRGNNLSFRGERGREFKIQRFKDSKFKIQDLKFKIQRFKI
jgi:hypothetical protein